MKSQKPVKAPKTMPEIPTILKMPREPKPESNNLGEVLGLKPEVERRDSAPPTAEPSTPPSKATKANTPQADQAAAPMGPPETTSPMTTLPGITIHADVLTYGPDFHRARIRIITPTERYYKLVVRHVA